MEITVIFENRLCITIEADQVPSESNVLAITRKARDGSLHTDSYIVTDVVWEVNIIEECVPYISKTRPYIRVAKFIERTRRKCQENPQTVPPVDSQNGKSMPKEDES